MARKSPNKGRNKKSGSSGTRSGAPPAADAGSIGSLDGGSTPQLKPSTNLPSGFAEPQTPSRMGLGETPDLGAWSPTRSTSPAGHHPGANSAESAVAAAAAAITGAPHMDHLNNPLLRSPSKPLANQLQHDNDMANDELWRAQVDNQELREAHSADVEQIQRLMAEISRERSEKEEHTQRLEQLAIEHMDVTEELRRLRNQEMAEKNANLTKLENRDEYIAELQALIERHKKDSEEQQRELQKLRQLEAGQDGARHGGNGHASGHHHGPSDSSLSGADTTTDLSASDLAVPQTPGHSDLLQASRQQQALKQMRRRLLAERQDKFKLRQRLAELEGGEKPEWTEEDEAIAAAATASASEDDTPQSPLLDHSLADTTQGSLKTPNRAVRSGRGAGRDDETPKANSKRYSRLFDESLSADGGFALSDEVAPSREQLERDAELLGLRVVSPSQVAGTSTTTTITTIGVAADGAPSTPVSTGRQTSDEVGFNAAELRRLAHDLEFTVMPVEEQQLIHNLLHRKYPTSPQKSHVMEDVLALQGAAAAMHQHPAGGQHGAGQHGAAYRQVGLSAEDVTNAAAALNLKVLPSDRFELLSREAADSRAPNAAKVAELASRAGLKVVPEDPTIDELRGVAGSNIVVTDRQSYEALEMPGPTTLRQLAQGIGLAVLPAKELEHLEQQAQQARRGSSGGVGVAATSATTSEPSTDGASAASGAPEDGRTYTVDEIRKIAETQDLVVLSPEDYQLILTKSSPQDFSTLPMSQRTKYFESVVQSQNNSRGVSPRNSPVHASGGGITERLQRLGLVSISQEEYQQLQDAAKYNEPTKSDVIQAARKHGLATLPIDEYSRMRTTKWSSPLHQARSRSGAPVSPTRGANSSPNSSRRGSADESGRAASPPVEELRAVPAAYLASLQRMAESPSLEDLQLLASKANVLVYADTAAVRQAALKLGMAEPLSDEGVLERARELGWGPLLSNDQVLVKARAMGLCEPLQDHEIRDHAKTKFGLVEPPSDVQTKQRALSLGLVEPMSTDELLERAKTQHGLVEPLSDDEIKRRAQSLGLRTPPTDMDVRAKALQLGLVEPISDAELLKRAKKLGLAEPLTETQVRKAAESMGLAPPPTEAEIREKARLLGLKTPPTQPEVLALARQVGLVDPPTNDEILKRARHLGLVDKLGPEDIKDEARRLGLTDPLTEADVKAWALNLGLVPPPSEGEVLGLAKSLGLVDRPTDDEIADRARSMGFVPHPTDEDIKLKALTLGLSAPPTADEIKHRATALGLIEPDDVAEIKKRARALGLAEPLSDAEIKARAIELGLEHPLPDHEVKHKAKSLGLTEPLTDEEIKQKALNLGLAHPLEDHEVKHKAKSLGLTEPLTDEEIKQKALNLGLAHPLEDHEVKHKAKSLGLTEPLTDEEIKQKALNLGLAHPLEDHEVKHKAKSLGLTEPLEDHEVKARAFDLGLVEPLDPAQLVAQAKQHHGLVDPQDGSQIKSIAKQLGLVDPPQDFEIKQKARALGLIEPLGDGEIKYAAHRLGMTEPLGDDEILAKARALGLVEPLPEHEVKLQARSLGLLDPREDVDAVRAHALGFGLVDPPQPEEIMVLAKQLGLVDPPTPDDVRVLAVEIGLEEPPTDEEICERAMQLGLAAALSDAEIVERSRSLGMREHMSDHEVKAQALALGLVEPDSETDVIIKAQALGLVHPPSEIDILSRSKELGLVEPPSEAEIVERAAQLGMLHRDNHEHVRQHAFTLGLVEPPSEDDVRERARALGFCDPEDEATVVKLGLNNGLIMPPTDEEIAQLARGLNLREPPTESEIRAQAEALGLVPAPTENELKYHGLRLGLVEQPTEEDIIAKAKALGLTEQLTREDIIVQARKHGLVEQPSKAELYLHARQLGLVEPPTDTDICERAKQLGLVEPTSARAGSEPAVDGYVDGEAGQVDDDDSFSVSSESVEREEAVGADSAPDADAATSTKAKADAEAKAKTDADGDEVPEDFKSDEDRAFETFSQGSPTTAERPSGSARAALGHRAMRSDGTSTGLSRSNTGLSRTYTMQSRTFTIQSRTSTMKGPEPPREDGVGHSPLPRPGSAMSETLLPHELASPQSVRNSPRGMRRRFELSNVRSPSRVQRTPLRYGRHHSNVAPPRTGSMSSGSEFDLPVPRSMLATGLSTAGSQWSLTTLLDDPQVLLQQLATGEVLYKYFGGGFTFEGITGGRHRRYFWVNPRTKQLFWHRENPQFIGKFVPTAKSITIVSVEEVSDHNPLPPALHHRTLIIKGRERDVKVTCATQGRHQVWISALRYLTQPPPAAQPQEASGTPHAAAPAATPAK